MTFGRGPSGAVQQIAVYEKCADASFVPFCDLVFRLVGLAFQVGRGLVPYQSCFGVLTADTRESTRIPLGYSPTYFRVVRVFRGSNSPASKSSKNSELKLSSYCEGTSGWHARRYEGRVNSFDPSFHQLARVAERLAHADHS